MSLLHAEILGQPSMNTPKRERGRTEFFVPKRQEILAVAMPVPQRAPSQSRASSPRLGPTPNGSSVRGWVRDGAYVFSRFGYAISGVHSALALGALVSYYAGVYFGQSLLGAALYMAYGTFPYIAIPVFIGSLVLSGIAKGLSEDKS